jgi:hypothetical protein
LLSLLSFWVTKLPVSSIEELPTIDFGQSLFGPFWPKNNSVALAKQFELLRRTRALPGCASHCAWSTGPTCAAYEPFPIALTSRLTLSLGLLACTWLWGRPLERWCFLNPPYPVLWRCWRVAFIGYFRTRQFKDTGKVSKNLTSLF